MNTTTQLMEVFDFEGNDFSVVELDGKLWFRSTEVTKILGIVNSSQFIAIHCGDHHYREFSVGVGRPCIYLTESGLYRVMMRAKTLIACKFQDWVTDEVLPSLRAKGGYIIPTATPDQLEALQEEIAALQSQNLRLKKCNEILDRVAGATLDDWHRDLKYLFPKLFKVDRLTFKNSLVDDLIDMSAERWMVESRMGEYYWKITDLVAATKVWITQNKICDRKLLIAFEKHFADVLAA